MLTEAASKSDGRRGEGREEISSFEDFTPFEFYFFVVQNGRDRNKDCGLQVCVYLFARLCLVKSEVYSHSHEAGIKVTHFICIQTMCRQDSKRWNRCMCN